jgi:hypothetical protein
MPSSIKHKAVKTKTKAKSVKKKETNSKHTPVKPEHAHVIQVSKVKHVKRKHTVTHSRPHTVRKVRTVYINSMQQPQQTESMLDPSYILKKLAPIVICIGVVLLLLYLLYNYASSAMCNTFGSLLKIVGFCGGSSASNLLGTGVDIAGKVIGGAATIVDKGAGVACGLIGC